METLNISFNAFKAAFPKTDKVYAVTSTQWADGTGSKQVVDLYAVKSGYLMQCSVLESELEGYELLNNAEMGDGVTQSAISNAIAVGI
jgi:hypothetical protein